MGSPACRSCAGRSGHVVLDLGNLPACDHFPEGDDPGPDPTYPLQMWLCSSCGLAQLLGEPTLAEEPRGTEPQALVAQAQEAVHRLATAGWLSGRVRVAEFGSPHGGSWMELLTERGLTPVADGEPADVVVDSFGMMHATNQSAALAERIARVAPRGVLALQYHSLASIIRQGQWNALRHGHFAYYSTTAVVEMLASKGFAARVAWCFDLYGGTVLLVASREAEPHLTLSETALPELLSEDTRVGVRDPGAVGRLQSDAQSHTQGLRDWLVARRSAGRSVLGYGAASRAVALLSGARVERQLLPEIVDTSRSKHGRRMPGTDIPIVGPSTLARQMAADVLLFVPDLLAEVRRAFPEVESSGGQWVDAEALRA